MDELCSYVDQFGIWVAQLLVTFSVTQVSLSCQKPGYSWCLLFYLCMHPADCKTKWFLGKDKKIL